jgi:agmatine deiminase
MPTPLQRRLPAEWEAQAAIILAWPHEQTDWRDNLPATEACFANILQAITERERAVLLCPDADVLRKKLHEADIQIDRIRFAEIAYDDTWTRDYGPITVYEDRRPVLLDFAFNGWGGKYAAENDDVVPQALAESRVLRNSDVRPVDFVLEGGAIESDGMGTILTTTSCLLAKTRNGGLSRSAVEAKLSEYLGAERVLWLESGYLEGDDTDGHVDMIARFCDPATIAYVKCDNPRDAHYPAFAAMEAELAALKRPDGSAYTLVPLPWPTATYFEEKRLPLSYANFLIMNEAVLLPTYGVAQDLEAMGALLDAFPDRDVVGVDCSVLVRQGGSLHCSTMQLPKGVLV